MPTPTRNEFIALVKKYQERKASPEEIEFIRQYYQYFDQEEKISLNLSAKEKELLGDKLFSNIKNRIGVQTNEKPIPSKILSFNLLTRRRIAAAIIFFLITGSAAYLFLRSPTQKNIVVNSGDTKRFRNDVGPGGDKATLTLADGTKINLDSVHAGAISQQGSAKVSKFGNGLLAYHSPVIEISSKNTAVFFNTITTPRGGQYQVVLADGSKVWLNAASSLRYPTSFTGRQRFVELTGEAYFEVSHLNAKSEKGHLPFVVKIINASGARSEVEVLGTHFNINAYNDESVIKTSLLEGSVKMTQVNNTILLVPGQQAQANSNGDIKIISDVDMNEATAWKNGMFEFKKADIKTIMRQIARWYDVEIQYQKNVDEKFYAEISRNTNVSNVFKMLEETGGVHFEIDGKKVTVMP